jgi:inosine/xanthosine triphosphate pyrophosphatase family protein
MRLEAHRSPYKEPYGLQREAFLRAGIDDVIRRAGSNRLVFIEDTTARIPALSTDDTEHPGQRTKEWFAETTHERLLQELDAVGQERVVIVRSDIALHVPGLPSPVLFSGVTEGKVVEKLESIDRDLLYPWLGQSDLSSWFVPVGARRVLAAMSMEESVHHDFRVRALSKLAERLKEYHAVVDLLAACVRKTVPPVQGVYQPRLFFDGFKDLVLVVIGHMAAGKTTAGDFLALHRDFHHIEGSRALVDAARLHEMEVGASGFDLADGLFARFGYDVVEREVVIPLLQSREGPVVYTGCRTIEGVSALVVAARRLGRRLAVLHVSTPASIRLVRAADRGREARAFDALAFDEASRRDAAYGAVRLAPLICDFQVLNRRDLGSFLRKLDEVLGSMQEGRNRVPQQRARLAVRVAACRTPVEVARVLSGISQEMLSGEDSTSLSTRGEIFCSLLDGGDRTDSP